MGSGRKASCLQNSGSLFIVGVVEGIEFRHCLGSAGSDTKGNLCCIIRIIILRVCFVADFRRHIKHHCIDLRSVGIEACTDNAGIPNALKSFGAVLHSTDSRHTVGICSTDFRCPQLHIVAETIFVAQNIFAGAIVKVINAERILQGKCSCVLDAKIYDLCTTGLPQLAVLEHLSRVVHLFPFDAILTVLQFHIQIPRLNLIDPGGCGVGEPREGGTYEHGHAHEQSQCAGEQCA